jgi:hypothetical protein
LDRDGRSGGEFADIVIIGKPVVSDHLDILQAGAIVDFDEGKRFGIPPGADPPLDENGIKTAFLVEQNIDLGSLHVIFPYDFGSFH